MDELERLLPTEPLYLWTGAAVVLLLLVVLVGLGRRRRGGGAPRGIKVGNLSEDWLARHRDWRHRR